MLSENASNISNFSTVDYDHVAPGMDNNTAARWFHSNLTSQSRAPELRQAVLVFYLATFFVGTAGNSLVIYIIAYYKSVRTKSVANYYIWNLSFADLFYILMLPFMCWATFTLSWPFGWFVCKLSYAIIETNKFASVFTLVALSLDRYVASFYNLSHLRTIRVGKIVCLLIWFLCLAISLPYWVFATTHTKPGDTVQTCRFSWPREHSLMYRTMWTCFQFVIGLLVPTLLIFGSYLLLARRMKQLLATRGALRGTNQAGSSESRSRIQKPSRRMTRTVLVVVTTFLFCQTPYHVVRLMSLTQQRKSEDAMAKGLSYVPSNFEVQLFMYLNPVTQILVFISSCCNPIIYGLLNQNYRKYTILRFLLHCLDKYYNIPTQILVRWVCLLVMYRIKPEELYFPSCGNGRSRRPRPEA